MEEEERKERRGKGTKTEAIGEIKEKKRKGNDRG